MPTDDDRQPLITEPAQVTGEYAIITSAASAEWERHYATCFLCQYGEERCSEGQRLLQRATGGQE